MSETVLVTGGTGYVAGWCITELLKRGYDVRTTVRSAKREQVVTGAVASEVNPAGRLTFATADLTADTGWDEAMHGVTYVLHVASPLGVQNDSAADLITPARDGSLRVLRAAAKASVKRVVMTSAANAASPSSYATEGVTDETLWTDPADPTLIPYRRSKTLAERAAWDFIENNDTGDMELTTVLPGAVFGPILTTSNIGSVGIIARMLKGEMAGIPRIGLEIVDVRDLVDVHLRAMTSPAAAGQRFLATGEFMWMADMAQALHDGLGARGSRVSTRHIPDFAVRLAARFRDPSLREITPALGRRNRHSTEKARTLLGWQPRPARQSVLDCANSLIAHNAV
ncbi:NAD-dependent epimerase/dehydratase family protein [Streptomyces griseoluteus]|uniref:NAD-dependent epimerase/dehydratase family protein n=1 Tax=Streptomyces griseoluteus TaxID=29306 RepID=A0A4Z1CYT7_STRGP|nr:NAD-dependent epimerase/dehydratase family protein [Streptomyces griseoluteus]TGN74388.1 NAD-dependent epimerase/dehydratase family protein [Streptomyces griseoluteus]